jgi:hypothetical protein
VGWVKVVLISVCVEYFAAGRVGVGSWGKHLDVIHSDTNCKYGPAFTHTLAMSPHSHILPTVVIQLKIFRIVFVFYSTLNLN